MTERVLTFPDLYGIVSAVVLKWRCVVMNTDVQYQYVAKIIVDQELFPLTILYRGEYEHVAQEVVRIICCDLDEIVVLVPTRPDVVLGKVVWDAQHSVPTLGIVTQCSHSWALRKQIPYVLAWLDVFFQARGVRLTIK